MAVRSDKNFVRSSSYYLGSSFCPQRPKARCFILQHVVLLSSQDTFYASLLGMSLDYDYTEGYESPVYEDISPDELSSDDSGQRDLGQRDPDTPFSTVATPGQLESDDSFSDYGSNETVTDSYDSDENSTTDFDNGWEKATLSLELGVVPALLILVGVLVVVVISLCVLYWKEKQPLKRGRLIVKG